MSCFVMVKRKTRSRDCFGFANNIYEEAFKELYNLSSYKRPFETLCYLFVTMAGMVCMLDVHGKRQTAKKLLPPSAFCRLYTYVNVLALLVDERTFVIFVLEVLKDWRQNELHY